MTRLVRRLRMQAAKLADGFVPVSVVADQNAPARRVGGMYGTEAGLFVEVDGGSEPFGSAVPSSKAF